MRGHLGVAVVILCLISALGVSAQTPGQQVEIKAGLHYNYLLYLPQGYESGGKPWPFILFLHGAGERGSQLSLVKAHGPPKVVANSSLMQKVFGAAGCPFIVVSPQCPANEWWLNEYLTPVLQDVLAKYSIDRKRMYMTGLSMGGFGTWSYASEFPDLFAAIIPISGGANAMDIASGYTTLKIPAAKLENLGHVPIWCFHGRDDTTVPPALDEKAVKAVQAIGGNAFYTLYWSTGHDAWTRTYDKPFIYPWLLTHVKSSVNAWSDYR